MAHHVNRKTKICIHPAFTSKSWYFFLHRCNLINKITAILFIYFVCIVSVLIFCYQLYIENIAYGPGDIYRNIPKTDTRGEDQLAKFLDWNPDPIGSEPLRLAELQPSLAQVVAKARQDNPDLKFVVGAGKRTKEQQQQAIEWGWSKTISSDHLSGHAVDLWPLDKADAVIFDKQKQDTIAKAMQKAAQDLGIDLDVGATWNRFQDMPHFALKAKEGRAPRSPLSFPKDHAAKPRQRSR